MASQSLNIPLRSQCHQKKIRYQSRLVAEEHAKSIARSDKYNRPTATDVVVFYCSTCTAYHTGHKVV